MNVFYKNLNTPQQKCYVIMRPPYSPIEMPAVEGNGPGQKTIFNLYQQRLPSVSKKSNIPPEKIQAAMVAGMAEKWFKKFT